MGGSATVQGGYLSGTRSSGFLVGPDLEYRLYIFDSMNRENEYFGWHEVGSTVPMIGIIPKLKLMVDPSTPDVPVIQGALRLFYGTLDASYDSSISRSGEKIGAWIVEFRGQTNALVGKSLELGGTVGHQWVRNKRIGGSWEDIGHIAHDLKIAVDGKAVRFKSPASAASDEPIEAVFNVVGEYQFESCFSLTSENNQFICPSVLVRGEGGTGTISPLDLAGAVEGHVDYRNFFGGSGQDTEPYFFVGLGGGASGEAFLFSNGGSIPQENSNSLFQLILTLGVRGIGPGAIK
jgi:hypothetical protein